MFFLWIVLLVNAFASQADFINKYRLSLGFVYLGMVEFFVAGGIVLGLFFGNGPTAAPKNRTHPMMIVIFICLGLGFISGWIGAAINQTPLEYVLRSVRDYVVWPASVYMGYRLLPNSRSAWNLLYAIVVGGIFAATMSITHFAQNAEFVTGDNINAVRSINYMVAFGGVAAVVLTYSMLVKKVRMLPWLLAAVVAVYCLVGECAPLARGEWLAMIVCFSSLFLILPPGQRASTLLKGLIVGPLILCGIYFAILGASSLMHHDFGEVVQKRLISLLPTERVTSKETKAWDTRLPSMTQELGMWMENPIMGQGFAAQMGRVVSGKMTNMGAYNHNGWSGVLASTGLFGFAGCWSIIGAMFVIGRRMVRSDADRGTVLFGATAFICSVYLFIGALSGMVWGGRMALLFGLVCGGMFRLRDIQNSALTSMEYGDDSFETHALEEPSGQAAAF